MATMRPLRLRRELSKVTGANPAFAFYSDVTGPIYDKDIQGVVINRGKSERGGGHTANTFEMTINGAASAAVTGQNCRFFLRDLAAADLAARTGQTAESIMYRYQGRMGIVSVEDTPQGAFSTLSAASWLTRMYRSSRTTTPLTGQTIDRIFTDVLGLATPPRGVSVQFAGDFDPIFGNQEPVNFKDALTRYGSDIGIGFYEQRDGSTVIMGLPYRKARADNRAATYLPLTRSQAVSPAVWEQTSEYTADRILFDVTNANGSKVTRTIDIESDDTLKETTREDWSYIQSDSAGTSGQLYQEAYGRVFESNTRTFSIPSVKIDLLYLINSPYEYHRQQAGQLLAMQVGDPVFFSGDWPNQLAGVHFAEGMTETVTPTSWTIELELVRYAIAVGETIQPTIKPRVWSSANQTWASNTNIWGNA